MALTEATVTFDLHQLLGDDFDTRRTRAYVKTNVESGTLMDTDTGETRLGDQRVTIASDGTGSFTTWAPGADGNPTSWQTSLVVEYARLGQRNRATRTFGPYTITTDADLTELEEEQAVPAEYLTTVTTALDAYVTDAEGFADAASASADAASASADAAAASAAASAAEAVAIVIADADAAMAAAIEDDASETSAALAASIDEQAVPRSLAPIPLDSSYSTTATLDALLATLSDGAVLEIPPGVTINRSTALTLPVPMTIKGDGTLKDTRTSPGGAFITIGPAASGSKILCRLEGVKAGSYVANHHAVLIQGTDNGATTAPTYVTDVVVDSPEISGFGSFAVYAEFPQDCQFDIEYAHDLGYGGIIGRSADNVSAYIRRLYNVTPGVSESYGIQFDRRDASSDLVRYPHSKNCSGRIDVARSCSNMNMMGTHGGQGIELSWGAAYGVKRPLDIVPASGSGGTPAYAPNDVSFSGGYASSGVTNGTNGAAANIAGAYDTGGSAVVEYAKGISGRIGVLVGFGTENDSTAGAVYCHTTRGLSVEIGSIREPAPYAVSLYHDNIGFTLRLGSVMDPWTTSGLIAGLVNLSSINNTGWILSASAVTGSKSATYVNNRGLNINTDASNVVRLAPAADFSSATTPVEGTPASSYQRPLLGAVGSSSAPTYSFDGDPNTGLYWLTADSIGVAAGGSLQLRFNTSGILMAAGKNIGTDTFTGMKIGTGATEKLGFWNATPTARPSAVADATDATTVITQLNALLSRLRTIGLIAP